MPLLRESRDDFLALVAATAADISYPPAWVEKDYWITEILRSLAEPYDEHLVVFKGGTSLSKVWRLIRRMSQDVDILLVPPDGSSNGARDRALKAVTARVGNALHIEPTLVTSSTGVHRKVTINYDPTFEDPTVLPNVLLELGVRGGPDPNEKVVIRSFIAEYALEKAGVALDEFDEFRAVEMRCLRPERTLVEKFSAVHHLATSAVAGKGVAIGTNMRHYYDIAMLLRSDEVREQLERGVLPAIAQSVDARSASAGWEYSERPALGYGDSPAFSETFVSRADARAAYGSVLDLVVGGPRPTLADVVKEIHEAASLL